MEDPDPSLRTLNEMQEQYKIIKKIGGGSFGLVYKARNKLDDKIVAIKLLSIPDDGKGVPSSLIREIALLKDLHHDYIIRLLENRNIGEYIFLVFEYLDCDMCKYMKKNPLEPRNLQRIKKFLFQILSGVAYCHSVKIIHRDLKPANLLVASRKEVVKIADFGLARAIGVPSDSYTAEVGTFWYRAPELAIGNAQYSTPVDVWSVGVIFAEMVRQGDRVPDVKLKQLSKMLSTPDPDQTRLAVDGLAEEVQGLEPDGVDLLAKMFRWNPDERITAEDALKHNYFRDDENVP